jgi:hypothetical protein
VPRISFSLATLRENTAKEVIVSFYSFLFLTLSSAAGRHAISLFFSFTLREKCRAKGIASFTAFLFYLLAAPQACCMKAS